MARFALASLLLGTLVACTTPELPDLGNDDDLAPDAMPLPPDARLDCELRHESVLTGHHNPGTECLTCHQGQDPAAPIFSMGGTAYADDDATIPLVGATVLVIDSNNKVVKMPTTQNGNFYTREQLVPPYITAISQCPDNVPMITTFTDGDCNTCHQPTGSPGRIYFDP